MEHRTLTTEQEEEAVDLMADGYPFDAAVAKVLGVALNPHGDNELFALGEKALANCERRGSVRRGKHVDRNGV